MGTLRDVPLLCPQVSATSPYPEHVEPMCAITSCCFQVRFDSVLRLYLDLCTRMLV
jgi:hypothetical protein